MLLRAAVRRFVLIGAVGPSRSCAFCMSVLVDAVASGVGCRNAVCPSGTSSV